MGVVRRLARLAQLENLGDVAGDRQAVRARRAGEGGAIAAVAAIADGVEVELAIEAAAKQLEPVGDIPVEVGGEGLELVGQEGRAIAEFRQLYRKSVG